MVLVEESTRFIEKMKISGGNRRESVWGGG